MVGVVVRGNVVVARGATVPPLRGDDVVVDRRGAVVVVPRTVVDVARGTVVWVEVVPVVEIAPSNGFDVSIFRLRSCGVVATLPWASVAVADTDQVPSASSGRAQPDVDDDTVNAQVFVVDPFVAVTTTRAPSSSPGMLTSGVESDVTLSVDEDPVSLDVARSGRDGTSGSVLSMPSDRFPPDGETLPAGSVKVPDTRHEPSVSVGNVHELSVPTVYEHDNEVDPLVAVIVAISPVEPPLSDIVGVVSFVVSSVSDAPESDDASKSTSDGFSGADVSTARLSGDAAALVLPASSVTAADTAHVPSVKVGRSHELAVPTVYEHDSEVDPLVAVTVTRSPIDRSGTEIEGVASFVTLSVLDVPESDAATRSTPPAAEDVPSTSNPRGEAAFVVLPAGSVIDPEMFQIPSLSVGRSHEVADPTVYEHDNEVVPLDAVIVTVSPVSPPASDTVGVVSDVTLSDADTPVSDASATSGVPVTVGPVPSTCNDIDGPADEVLPALSVTADDTAHVPSVSAGRSHDVAEPMTYEHDFVVLPLTALTVIVSPVDPPLPDTAGVVSDVRLSVARVPRSDASRRSGAAVGASGAVRSTERDKGAVAADTLPAGSVAVPVTDQVPSVSAGDKSHDEAEPTT